MKDPVVNYIKPHVDFFEVVNEFPILKEKLCDLQFRVSDIKEGETVTDFFTRNSLSNEEVNFIITKLNRELNNFMKQTDTKPVVEVKVVEEIEIVKTEEEE